MAATPKPERRFLSAVKSFDRWTDRSYSDFTDGNPAHDKQAQAYDRMDQKLKGHNRSFTRHVNRGLRERHKAREKEK